MSTQRHQLCGCLMESSEPHGVSTASDGGGEHAEEHGHGHGHGHQHTHGQANNHVHFHTKVNGGNEDELLMPTRMELVRSADKMRGADDPLRKEKNENIRRLLCMSALTLLVCVLELLTGISVHSLALVSDGMHMLSDFGALFVGIGAIHLTKRGETDDMSFGWKRADVVGGLMNGCFLLAICFFIVLEAVERIVNFHHVGAPSAVIVVGLVGLLVNTIGLCLFSGHGHLHGHGGHGHSHGGDSGHGHSGESHAHSHGPNVKRRRKQYVKMGSGDVADTSDSTTTSAHSTDGLVTSIPHVRNDKEKKANHVSMHGVFLHLLGDLLASIGVIISGSIVHFTSWEYRHMADPVISLLITLLIISSTVPLVKHTSLVLLEAVPSHVDTARMRRYIYDIPGIIDVHKMRVWTLTAGHVMASLHVTIEEGYAYPIILEKIKGIMSFYGVDDATVQHESISRRELREVLASLGEEFPSTPHLGTTPLRRRRASLSNHPDLGCVMDDVDVEIIPNEDDIGVQIVGQSDIGGFTLSESNQSEETQAV